MSGVKKKIVSADEDGMRVDRWFKSHYPALGHGSLEKLLRKGEIRINGGRVKSNRRLQKGEEIRIPPMSVGSIHVPKKIPNRSNEIANIRTLILYEDEAFFAFNKPFGLAVQGGTNTERHLDGMLGILGEGEVRPRLVHRLDKDTGGLLLVAKTRKAAQALTEAFRDHVVEKTYWSLVVSQPYPKQGTIDMRIAKRMVRTNEGGMQRVVPAEGEDSKKALTDYQTLDSAGRVTFLAMRPITGRTHQLRVHAAAIGAPIVGDGKYGGIEAKIEGVSSKLHLFCRSMTFPHPSSGRHITLSAPLTGHMAQTWKFFSFDEQVSCEWPQLS